MSTSIPDDAIWIVTEIPEAPSSNGERGNPFWGDTTGRLRQKPVSTATLEQNMAVFLQRMGRVLNRAKQSAGELAGMELDEIELSVEISGEGQVSLWGTGAKVGNKGAMTLKFKARPNQPYFTNLHTCHLLVLTMAKNWAIAIGINHYNPNNLSPLRFAKHDAEKVRDFFQTEAQFDGVYFFADDAPDLELPNGAKIPTYPSFGNLRSFLRDRFESPFLSTGDNFWFFFAGHGMQYANRDYLMPIDANPRDVEATAIPVSYVRERLSRCGADNIILILDACRTEGSRDSLGVGAEAQQGVIIMSACSPTQSSWEIEALQQGVFTYALLEALRLGGDRNCATVERLSEYLRCRVSDLCHQYGKAPAQDPRISVDPVEKSHFILLPQYATLADIVKLREVAYREAFIKHNLSLAEQLCIRANAAAMGRDMQILELYSRIKFLQGNTSQSSLQLPNKSPGDRTSLSSAPLATFAQRLTALASQAIFSLPSASTQMPRRQMLKLIGFGGVGVTLTALTQQIIQNQTSSSGWDSGEPPNSSGWGSEQPRAASSNPYLDDSTLSGWGSKKSSNSSGWGSEQPRATCDSEDTRSWQPSVFIRLEELLKAKLWQEADLETLKKMLAIVNREENWLDSASVKQLPRGALRHIDRLWMKYSNGRFGFSVQTKFYRGCGGKPVDDVDVDNQLKDPAYHCFSERVGWLDREHGWLFSSEATFTITAKPGHLPVDCFRVGRNGSLGEGDVLLRYLVNCNI